MGVDLSVLLAKPAAVENRTIEIITEEILHFERVAGEATLEIGLRLMEAKAQLGHGEWLPWLKGRVNFSERTAQKLMRLAREYKSNPQALADLGSERAFSLLALESGERDAFISETHLVDGEEKGAIDMTTRELEKAIQERKEALEAKEAAEEEAQAAEAAREKMEQEASLAKSRIDTLTEEAGRHLNTMEALRRELEELKARPIDITATNVPDASALEDARQAGAEEAAKTARQEAEAKLKDKLDKAAKAKAEAEAALKAASAERDALQDRATALEKQVKVSSSKDLAVLSVCFESEQETFHRIMGVMKKMELAGDVDAYNKSVDALHALFSALEARVPEKLEVSTS